MTSYYRTMEQFLEMQQDVMQAFLARRVAPRREETAKPPAELPTAPGVVALATLSAVSAGPTSSVSAVSAAPSVSAVSADSIQDLLLNIVSDRTGYPP